MFGRALTEGFKNLTRTFWLSVTAISVLVVSIGSVAILAALRTGIGFAVEQADDQLSIVVNLKDAVDTKEKEAELQSKIQLIDGVDPNKVKYVSKEETKDIISDVDLDVDKSIALIEENPFYDTFEVSPTSSEEYESVLNELKKLDGVEEVLGKQDIVDRLNNIFKWINWIAIGVIAIFAFISILVMMNILKISIHHFRDEIEIMKLMGATNSYIQQPFVVQGTMFNIIASAIVAAVFVPLTYYYGLPWIQEISGSASQLRNDSLVSEMYLSLGALVLSTIVAGVLVSYYATRRYLSL